MLSLLLKQGKPLWPIPAYICIRKLMALKVPTHKLDCKVLL
jgi:hypothetical protein